MWDVCTAKLTETFFNTSRYGKSTTALGSLFQLLTILSMKKSFPNIQPKHFTLPLAGAPHGHMDT